MAQNNNNFTAEQQAAFHALKWHVDLDIADCISDTPIDRTIPPNLSEIHDKVEAAKPKILSPVSSTNSAPSPVIGAAEAIVESKKIAAACNTLEELKQAIQDFSGLSIKKTATNLVFADGNPKAKIMVIGEAPGGDEDSQGKPFVGAGGQLLDKILASIGLNRQSEDLDKAVYITNILNWRPPGNRTPTAQEIEMSLPFIHKHIALIQPKYLMLCGAVPGKSLLNQKDSLSKLRGKFIEYPTQMDEKGKIISFVTYHPDYLLRTPAQKRAVWQDMLMLQKELKASN